MADSGGIRAGAAYVELFLKSKLEAGLNAAARRLQAFGSGVAGVGARMAALGAVGTAALGAVVENFRETGTELARMSARTGTSVETLSELGYAASTVGGGLHDVEGALTGTGQAVLAARNGSVEAARAFTMLGLSVSDLAAMSPEQRFNAIADGLARIPNMTNRAAVAQQAFGGQVGNLLPLLAQGSAGLARLREQGAALGATMGGRDAQAAQALTGAWGQMRGALTGVGNAIGATLAPSITDLLGRITPIVAGVGRWVRQNEGLVRTVAAVATGLVVGGTALVAIGTTISIVGVALGGLATAIGVVIAVTKFLILSAVAVAAALLTPVGALAALAIGALYASAAIGGFLAWMLLTEGAAERVFSGVADAVGTAVDWIGARFAEFREVGRAVWADFIRMAGVVSDRMRTAMTIAFNVSQNALDALGRAFGVVRERAAESWAIIGEGASWLGGVVRGWASDAAGAGRSAFAAIREAAGPALAFVGNGFRDLLGTAQSAGAGIVGALRLGEFALAGRIAMAGLRVAWLQGVAVLQEAWHGTMEALGVAAISGWASIQVLFVRGVQTLQDAWAGLAHFMAVTWADVLAGLQRRLLAFTRTPLFRAMGLVLDLGGINEQSIQAGRDQSVASADRDVARARAGNAEAAGGAAAGIEQDRGERVAAFQDRARVARERREQARGADIPKAQAELEGALAELRQAQDADRLRRKNTTADVAGPAGAGIEATRGAGIAGTFNAAGAQGLGGGGPVQQLVDATREGNRLARQVRDAVEKFNLGVA